MPPAKGDSFEDFVIEQLERLGGIAVRAMFGCRGIYSHGKFFAIIHKSRLYFKTNEKTREDYVEMGMKPFHYSRKQTLKNYYEVPPDVVEEPDELARWAERSVKS